MPESQERVLSTCTHKWLKTNCKKCGIFSHPESPAQKTSLYSSLLMTPFDKFMAHMRKRQC